MARAERALRLDRPERLTTAIARAGAWIVATVASAAALWWADAWSAYPEAALAAALVLGAAAATPRHAWVAPGLLLVGLAAAGTAAALGAAAPLGAAAVAGAAVGAAPRTARTTRALVSGALIGVGGAGLGAWSAVALVGSMWSDLDSTLVIAATTALGASLSALASMLRAPEDRLPSAIVAWLRLRAPYRAPALRAIGLARRCAEPGRAPAPEIIALARFTVDAQRRLQAQGAAIEVFSDHALGARSAGVAPQTLAHDAADHLRRLAAHREALVAERDRVRRHADRALAALEERAQLAEIERLSRWADQATGVEAALARVRSASRAVDAERRAAAEVAATRRG